MNANTKQPENPSAFPLPYVFSEIQGLKYSYDTGMSLRDWLAGQALIAYIGRNSNYTLAGSQMPANVKEISQQCYELADAMLSERSK